MQHQNSYGSAAGRKPGYLGGGIRGPRGTAKAGTSSAAAPAPSDLRAAEAAAQRAGTNAPAMKMGGAEVPTGDRGAYVQPTTAQPPPGLPRGGPGSGPASWGAQQGPAAQGLQDLLATLDRGAAAQASAFQPSTQANAPAPLTAGKPKRKLLGISWGWWVAAGVAAAAAAGTGAVVWTRRNPRFGRSFGRNYGLGGRS